MKEILAILVLLFIFNPLLSFGQDEEIIIGKTEKLISKILDEEREIFIHVPSGYELSDREYPVLYVLDGAGNFIHAVGTVSFLSNAGIIPQMIVIGIPNTVRGRDFTPTASLQVQNSGGGDNFLKFLEEELIPYLDNKYRTAPFRILSGHSITAMYSIYAMVNKPDLFNAYTLASPYVMYDQNYVIKHAEKNLPNSFNKKTYLYMTLGNEPDYVEHIDELTNIFKEKSPENFTWEYHNLENDDHVTVPLKTIYQGLEMIYKGWRLPAGFARSGTLEDFENHFKGLSDKYNYEIKIPEAQLNIFGYQVMAQRRMKEALNIFKRNIELYPSSANVYDSYAEGLEADNQLEEAKKHYQIAYEKGKETNDPNLLIFQQHLENIDKKINAN
jgi:uncharacterized protein